VTSSGHSRRIVAGLAREVRPLVECALRAGWTIERTGSNHLRLRGPQGQTLHAAGTPHSGQLEAYRLRQRLHKAGLDLEEDK